MIGRFPPRGIYKPASPQRVLNPDKVLPNIELRRKGLVCHKGLCKSASLVKSFFSSPPDTLPIADVSAGVQEQRGRHRPQAVWRVDAPGVAHHTLLRCAFGRWLRPVSVPALNGDRSAKRLVGTAICCALRQSDLRVTTSSPLRKWQTHE
jgi:hypothetical protein